MTSFLSQLKGVIYRKLILQWKGILGTLIIDFIAIILMIAPGLISYSPAPGENDYSEIIYGPTFGSVEYQNNLSITRIKDSGCDGGYCLPELGNVIKTMIKTELDIDAKINDFDSFEELDRYQKEISKDRQQSINNLFAYKIVNNSWYNKEGDDRSANITCVLFYNSSNFYEIIPIFRRAIYKMIYSDVKNSDIHYQITVKNELKKDASGINPLNIIMYFLLIPIGIALFTSFSFGQIIEDLHTQIRNFMISCGLNRFVYWLGNIIIDSVHMIIVVVIVHIIYHILNDHVYMAIKNYLFYSIFITMLSSIFFMYFMGFILPNRNSGATIILIFHLIIVIAAFSSGLLLKAKLGINTVRFIRCIFCIIPVNNLVNCFYAPLEPFITFGSQPSSITLFTDSYDKIPLIVAFVSALLFIIIIWIVEKQSQNAKKKFSKFGWSGHEREFKEFKDKQKITKEAIDMEQSVHNSSEEYAIKIKDVSKFYSGPNGKNIYAVNQVSLGIKKGSLFGFLGSNGAGKTTLMRIILRDEALSNGSVEIEGDDIEKSFDPKKISRCPQFDDHLTGNLTGRQNLKFFCYLYNKSRSETKEIIDKMVDTLDLSEHIDKKVDNMSGGNRRKCAVAITFISDANIILLDEPTSSLDPIARHKVHNLINEYRGEKTFMLCTHLLDEAENLCDNISIMLNGCVFTIGTPQYLSNRFGTEWKVDILLEDDLQETQEKITNFFITEIPSAVPSIVRPSSRIYTIPKKDIEINKLFKIMEKSQIDNIGIKFYTCSCSTLEKVFLEIVMLSESKDQSNANDENVNKS
ncbi:ABC transporter family protein [Trichomonas vaginalis G3]|uniref:ABC transporter family protein n=1 Tax=Trichomonas vaginalis (strain ATCC PRA-98 / G3) TaxID=412133 RepID=A2DNW5_TRIV3|nr:ATPase activity, coupled to transmembrane movement of substances [Trichomonas vaginalis G3]EAY17960.1 ABC transporter family protein [Trichomonas vaginalis G3]KAI5527142.1 ATPase activity, coupled to transmembrane movement of substances [Trichomonas vaginalis G3]|eukprot:XP_001578946.1 ABC transporter family protein [Trichomonas vaginalis G3]